jgi:hypothetical protein
MSKQEIFNVAAKAIVGGKQDGELTEILGDLLWASDLLSLVGRKAALKKMAEEYELQTPACIK